MPTNNSNNMPHRVFPSVVSVLQARAVSSQVVETLQHDHDVVMNILPADYDWQQAIQSSTTSRERAFLLLDLSAVVKARVELQQKFGNGVALHYRVQHNRDDKLLELCCRLGISLRTNSNMDVEAAIQAMKKQPNKETVSRIVDDASATRKPNGYLRRFLREANGNCLAVDGPEEVKRIHETWKRLRMRQQQQHDLESISTSLSFILRIPRDCNDWKSLIQFTNAACSETGTLVGVSFELIDDENYLHVVQTSLNAVAPLFEDGRMHVDVTGAVSKDMAPFLIDLAKSYRVSVDASALLVEHAGALCTRIIGVKEVGDVRHLYIDDGCYGSLYRDWNNDRQVERIPLPLLNTRSSETQIATVWGPTCDGLDCVCKNVVLPKMQVDEWLVFPDMGLASGMGTAFNGFDPPDVAYCVLGYFRQL